jgi:hypothetical protein
LSSNAFLKLRNKVVRNTTDLDSFLTERDLSYIYEVSSHITKVVSIKDVCLITAIEV